MNSAEQLGKDPILKLIARFSIPAIIAMTVNSIYNIADRVFISYYVGEQALAGLAITFPFMMFVLALGALFGIGGSALASIRLGEQKKDEADQIFGTLILIMLIVGVFVSVTSFIFVEDMLRLMGATDAILPHSSLYTKITLIGVTFQLMSFAMASLARIEGKPRLSMASQLASAICNIVLDYIFIALFNMGVAGAAIATVMSQFLGMAILSWYFLFSGKSLLRLHIHNLRLRVSVLLQMSAIGFSSFFMHVGMSLSSSLFNVALGTNGGDSAIATSSAIGSLFTLVIMPIFGFQQGLGPIIGYNYGMKSYARVQKALWYTIGIGSVFSTVMWILLMLFPPVFGAMFIDPDSPTMAMFIGALRIQVLMLPFLPLSVIGTSYFQSTAQVKRAFILGISRQILFLIPALVILPKFFGLTGVWMAAPTADLLSVLLVVSFLLADRKRLMPPEPVMSGGAA